MYSAVMMLALSGTAQVPDFGWRCGCCGWARCGCCGWRWRCGCCGFRRCCGCGGGCFGCGGCAGCVGCAGCAGCVGCAGYDGTAPLPMTNPPQKTENSSTPATIVVTVPEGAKLTFNGWTSQSTSTVRQFQSPPLEPGREYAYTLRAEVVRDGQTIVQTQQVVVRAGQESSVAMNGTPILTVTQK